MMPPALNARNANTNPGRNDRICWNVSASQFLVYALALFFFFFEFSESPDMSEETASQNCSQNRYRVRVKNKTAVSQCSEPVFPSEADWYLCLLILGSMAGHHPGKESCRVGVLHPVKRSFIQQCFSSFYLLPGPLPTLGIKEWTISWLASSRMSREKGLD